MRLSATTLIGLASGLLFFGHAMINGSHAWPLVWPALGGAAAAMLRARANSSGGRLAGLRTGGGAGLVAAAIFFAATAVALAAMGLLGPRGAAGLTGLALAGFIGLALAVVAGGVTYPLARLSRG